MTYAVTGSTGHFGAHAVQHLLKQGVAAKSVVALVRDPAKAQNLSALGVQVRQADYTQPAALAEALKGVDRLLLVSSSEVGQRLAQHQNVIAAARQAGVAHVVYTSISRADTSANPLAPEHKATEAALRASGLTWTFLRNNWYHENHLGDAQAAAASGVLAAAVGQGRVASASREDYAEAAARVLAGSGHEGKTYELTGSEAWNFDDLARAVSAAAGRPVTFRNVSAEERRQGLIGAGLPEGVAGFVVSLDTGIAEGTLAEVSGDLARLLGRAPTSLAAWLKGVLTR